jgi:hypothetical protein
LASVSGEKQQLKEVHEHAPVHRYQHGGPEGGGCKSLDKKEGFRENIYNIFIYCYL